MTFFSPSPTGFRSRRAVRPPSTKWVDLQPREKPSRQRTGRLNPVGKKGLFWQFCKAIWDEYFLKLENEFGLERRCEKCDGSAYCGVLTPAHSIRRNRIRTDDWYHALRVAGLGDSCHFDTDTNPDAEEIIEDIITARHKRLGITEDDWKQMLLTIAADIQAVDALKGEKARFQTFVVRL